MTVAEHPAAAIGREDCSGTRPALMARVAGTDDQIGAQRVRQLPAERRRVRQIDDDSQREPAFPEGT